MKKLYYIGLTFAITGFYAVAPTAAEAADENTSTSSHLDSLNESTVHHPQKQPLALSSTPSELREQKEVADSDVLNTPEQSSVPHEVLPPSSLPPHQHVVRFEAELETSARTANEINAHNTHGSSAKASALVTQTTSDPKVPGIATTSHTLSSSDSLLALAPQSSKELNSETEAETTKPNKAIELDISLSSAFETAAQPVLDTHLSETGTPYTFNNSDSLLALAPQSSQELDNETEAPTIESDITIEDNLSSSSPAILTPTVQSVPDAQASTETPYTFDSSASLLALNSKSSNSLKLEPGPIDVGPETPMASRTSSQPLIPKPVAQSAPKLQRPASEETGAFDNGASLLWPLTPDPVAETISETVAAPPSSITDSATPSAATPIVQNSLDTAPITPSSSEILDNYGLVSSVKGNKVSVRLLNGKNKTYKLAANTAGKNLRRGRLMGFNTDRRGRITHLAPPQIKKVYEGTLIIVEGKKIGMVTPQGERFITTLSKQKISRMGLAPGQPIKITQYRGTWATKVCRPGTLSNRQLSSDARQRQRGFLRGETSASL